MGTDSDWNIKASSLLGRLESGCCCCLIHRTAACFFFFSLKALEKPLGAREELKQGGEYVRYLSASLFLSFSLCQFVSPLFSPSLPLIFAQIVRTPLGAAGWESMHCWDGMRESILLCLWMRVYLFFLFFPSQMQVWSSSPPRCIADKLELLFKRGGAEERGENDFSVADLLCSEVNHISGERRSVSRARSRAAQLCQRVCQPGSPPNGDITANGSRRLNLLDSMLVDWLWGCFCPPDTPPDKPLVFSASEQLKINHL